MPTATAQLLAKLPAQLQDTFLTSLRKQGLPADTVPTGHPHLDLPRGAITEILGRASSGQTSFLLSTLATLTQQHEYCAYIDACSSLDVVCASQAGIQLDQLLWVQGGGDLDASLKSADLLLQAGGFGVLVLDVKDLPRRHLDRIPIAWWHRLRLAVEHTPTLALVIAQQPLAKASAALTLEITRRGIQWNSTLLAGLDTQITPRRGPSRHASPVTIPVVAA